MTDHPSSRRPSSLTPFKAALTALSRRTKTPLPSLALSFGILHELTAIVPFVCVFYTARTLKVGERIVDEIMRNDNGKLLTMKELRDLRNTNTYGEDGTRHGKRDGQNLGKRMIEECQIWLIEGEAWARRVGERYGIFGFAKRQTTSQTPGDDNLPAGANGRLAGDVANAIVAYGVTKAAFPLRIGLSMYLSPAFSRGFVEPFRKRVLRALGRNR